MMRFSFLSLVSVFALAAGACGGEALTDDELSSDSEALIAAVRCNPRDPGTCERGESCWSVNETLNVCTAGRCGDVSDCGGGPYVCRLHQCVRVERLPDPEPATCPRGSVAGRASCERGYELEVVSREPLCTACRPIQREPDPCAAVIPTARGTCRATFGWFWDGRVCVPLSGCELTSRVGLFATQEACAREHAICTAPTRR